MLSSHSTSKGMVELYSIIITLGFTKVSLFNSVKSLPSISIDNTSILSILFSLIKSFRVNFSSINLFKTLILLLSL